MRCMPARALRKRRSCSALLGTWYNDKKSQKTKVVGATFFATAFTSVCRTPFGSGCPGHSQAWEKTTTAPSFLTAATALVMSANASSGKSCRRTSGRFSSTKKRFSLTWNLKEGNKWLDVFTTSTIRSTVRGVLAQQARPDNPDLLWSGWPRRAKPLAMPKEPALLVLLAPVALARTGQL